MQSRFDRSAPNPRFRVLMLCFLVVTSAGGSGDETRAEENLSVGRDLAALAQRMDAFIDDLEQTLSRLESVSDGLERDYNASGDPVLLRRRDETRLRIDKLRRVLTETKAERARLKSLQGSTSDSDPERVKERPTTSEASSQTDEYPTQASSRTLNNVNGP